MICVVVMAAVHGVAGTVRKAARICHILGIIIHVGAIIFIALFREIDIWNCYVKPMSL